MYNMYYPSIELMVTIIWVKLGMVLEVGFIGQFILWVYDLYVKFYIESIYKNWLMNNKI